MQHETLRDRFHSGPLLSHAATGIAIRLAKCVALLHAKGRFHGDLKPECIVIGRDGSVSLSEDVETEPVIADYTAPEQVRGEPASALSDIFSFGVVYYEMLTGNRPFLRRDLRTTCKAIIDEALPQPPPPEITPSLERIINGCLRKKPQDRIQSAADLAFTLEAFAGITINSERRGLPRPPSFWVIVTALACSGIGVIIGGLLARQFLRPSILVAPTFRNLTYSGNDSSPAVAPDGSLIAFTSSRDGVSKIWLYDTAKGTERVLTAGPDRDARFSPDGREILFIRNNSAWRMAISGGAPVKMLSNVTFADWSPRGGEIAWTRTLRDAYLLGLSRLDGSNPRNLIQVTDQPLHHPRWSTDGAMLAVSGTSVLTVAANGAEKMNTLASFSRGLPSGVVWSNDNRYVLYLEITGGSSFLVRQNARDGASVLMGYSPQRGQVLDVLSANQIVFDGVSGFQAIFETDRFGKSAQIARGGRDPSYSPLGLLFASARGIFDLSTQTGVTRRIVEDNNDNIEPYFAAGQVFWASNRNGHFEVWASDREGQGVMRVTSDGGDARSPSASTDGVWVVYNSSTPGRKGVRRIRPNGDDDTLLVAGDTAWPAISPDGNSVLFSQNGHVKAVTISGAPLGLDIPAIRGRWMPGGKSIAYSTSSGVYERELAGFGPGRPLDIRTGVESFSISPDGSKIAVCTRDQSTDLVVADNLPGFGLRTTSQQR